MHSGIVNRGRRVHRRRVTARPLRSALRGAIAIAVLVGCADGGSSPTADGGTSRDATVINLPFLRGDGAVVGDGATLPLADGGVASCGVGVCDPRQPNSCDEGAQCLLAPSGVPSCETNGDAGVPGGAVPEGEPCETTAECGPRMACFRRGARGACARVCCPNPDDLQQGCVGPRACVGSGPLVDGTATQWWHCIAPRPCDVFAPQAVCEPGEGCYIVTAEGDTDCRRAGGGEVGASCRVQSDCAPGLACGGLTEPTCGRICVLDAAPGPTCSDDEGECLAYSHSPAGTGICTVED